MSFSVDRPSGARYRQIAKPRAETVALEAPGSLLLKLIPAALLGAMLISLLLLLCWPADTVEMDPTTLQRAKHNSTGHTMGLTTLQAAKHNSTGHTVQPTPHGKVDDQCRAGGHIPPDADVVTPGCIGGFVAGGKTCHFALPLHVCESTTCVAGLWNPSTPTCTATDTSTSPPTTSPTSSRPIHEAPSQNGPDLPTVIRTGPTAVNLGLPRTGTTSLHDAVLQLGLNSSHIAELMQTEAGTSRALFELFLSGSNVSEYVNNLLKTDVLGDTPFYLQTTKQALLRHYPNTQLFCTHSPKARWVDSVIKHGNAGRHVRLLLLCC